MPTFFSVPGKARHTRKKAFRFILNPLLLLLVACAAPKEAERTEAPAGFRVSAEGDALTLGWGGKPRLSGGSPVFEGKPFAATGAEADGSAGTFRFTGPSAQPVELTIDRQAGGDVAILSLTARGNQSPDGEKYLGLLFDAFPGYKRGIAFYCYDPVKAWTYPVPVPDPGRLPYPKDLQCMLWQYEDSTYAAAMPLGGKGYNATLGAEGGRFGAKSVSLVDHTPAEAVPLLAVSFGKDPFRVVDQLYEAGLTAVGKGENLRRKKQYPAAFEGIGWCTWNAYGHALSESKIMAGVHTFTGKKFPLPFLLIDDGWLNITGPNGQLKTFTPDPAKFPGGLKPVVDRLRREHGVRHVGVWHTINAYWGGVDSTGELGRQYRDLLMPYRDKVTWTDKPVETFYGPTVQSEAGFRFYDDWYGYLKGQGISFVKVDNQLVVDRMARRNRPLWEAAGQAEANLQKAAAKHFGGAVVNCMDMTTNVLYHLGSSAVARAVEDYFPEDTTYRMHHGNAAVHVLCALTNSLWLSPMVWPDYDMFQSHHPDAHYHAIARAISGGPVYFTDAPGKQRFEVIWPLIYRDGRIIRSDVPARPTEDCLFQVQEARPFKAFSRSGEAGLLGVWNVADADRVTGTFRAADVAGLPGENFAVYEYFSRQLRVVARDEALPLDLKRMGYALYYVVPLKAGAAPLGLLNKYNAPKTITRQSVSANALEATVAEGGTFGACLAKAPARVAVDGRELTPQQYRYEGGLLTVPLDETGGARTVQVGW